MRQDCATAALAHAIAPFRQPSFVTQEQGGAQSRIGRSAEIQPALGTGHFKTGNQPAPHDSTRPLSKMRQKVSGKIPLLLQMPDESPQVEKTTTPAT